MRFSTNNTRQAIVTGALMREIEKAEALAAGVPLPLVLNHTEPYFLYMSSAQKRSIDSVQNAVCSISAMVEWFWKVKGISPVVLSFSHLSKENVLEWLNYEMKEKGICAATRNQHLVRLKMFLLYVTTEVNMRIGHYFLQVSSLPVLAEETGAKDVLSEEQMANIIIQACNTDGIHAQRNGAMLLLLYESMARVSELCNMKVRDLCFREQQVRRLEPDGTITQEVCEVALVSLFGKGKKFRTLELNPECTIVMKNYLAKVHPCPEPDSPLFCSLHGGCYKHICARSVELIVADSAKAARVEDPAIPERVYPHMCRRSKATTLYERGTPIETVSVLLGHSMVDTTIKHYAKPSKEQIREALNKVKVAGKVSEAVDKKKQEISEKEQLKDLIRRSGLRVK